MLSQDFKNKLKIWASKFLENLLNSVSECDPKRQYNTTFLMFTSFDSSKYMFLLFMKDQKHSAIEAEYHIYMSKKILHYISKANIVKVDVSWML